MCHWLQVIAERAAAVAGNLSTREEFFPAMRESGALQRLVALLDDGPTSRCRLRDVARTTESYAVITYICGQICSAKRPCVCEATR